MTWKTFGVLGLAAALFLTLGAFVVGAPGGTPAGGPATPKIIYCAYKSQSWLLDSSLLQKYPDAWLVANNYIRYLMKEGVIADGSVGTSTSGGVYHKADYNPAFENLYIDLCYRSGVTQNKLSLISSEEYAERALADLKSFAKSNVRSQALDDALTDFRVWVNDNLGKAKTKVVRGARDFWNDWLDAQKRLATETNEQAKRVLTLAVQVNKEIGANEMLSDKEQTEKKTRVVVITGLMTELIKSNPGITASVKGKSDKEIKDIFYRYLRDESAPVDSETVKSQLLARLTGGLVAT
ncbi:hypothetical protein HY572_04310 [Candidatus Micrarchaeota archaeon]|nr:hypothetical protein [Candidatus Micrarchaeota archaeon]